MSRCFLGSKKVRKIESILGRKIVSASVRGGNEHFWASVLVEEGQPTILVNYKTGKIVTDPAKAYQDVQDAFDVAWKAGASEQEAKAAAKELEAKIWG